VQNIEFNGARFHIKAYPELPGMEYAITMLHNLVVGGGTALSRLVAVRHKKNQNSYYPLIISETIEGPILQKVLLETPATVPNMDMKSFSQAIIMALLTNPEGTLLAVSRDCRAPPASFVYSRIFLMDDAIQMVSQITSLLWTAPRARKARW
jgi:hypothetical protein